MKTPIECQKGGFLGVTAAFILLIFSGCYSGASKEAPKLSGTPSWFPLGGEVYHEDERFEAEKEILQFQEEPRWFLGFPRKASKKEYEAWIEKEHFVEEQNSFVDDYQIPTYPPYPETLEKFPSKVEGATLDFRISKGSNPKELLFILSLKAEARAVSRELEHRWTNTLPFLFAFYADGKAIKTESVAAGKIGGSNYLIELVPAVSVKQWELKVDVESIKKITGRNSSEITVVAAFSERQHEANFGGLAKTPDFMTTDEVPPQITIHSNTFRLRATAQGWEPLEASSK